MVDEVRVGRVFPYIYIEREREREREREVCEKKPWVVDEMRVGNVLACRL